MSLAAYGLAKRYGARVVFEGVDLRVEPGELLAVLGLSGIGKSTLLRVLACVERADTGRVELCGAPRTRPGREVFLIFQNFDQLFPWLTLEENLRYALRRARLPDAAARARTALEQVGLSDAAGRLPRELSGGMKQRGALARALALESRVLLLDEPFSSLDPATRRDCGALLTALRRERGFAGVFVTHDVSEALALGTRAAVLDAEGLHEFDLSRPDAEASLRRALRAQPQ